MHMNIHPLAIAGFVLSILALGLFATPWFLLGALGAILSFVMVNYKAQARAGRGLAVAGLVISLVALCLGIVWDTLT